MNHVLAIDQGTTSTRVLVIDGAMHVRAAAQRALTQHYPRPGWVEHDAEEIWQTTLACTQEALAAGRLTHREIAAIGITNQRETTILWDRETAQPVAPAIVWQDRRTADLCDDLRQRGLSQHVQQTTGLVIDAYFCATKIRWLLDHLPHLQQRCLRGEIAFGTVDAWLLYRLTGGRVHATDVTNASRTMLFDLHAMQWDDELLELLQIPRQILPDVRPSSGILGTTTLFGGEIPIAGMAGDQHAALFGQACHETGMAKNTYGTGSFLLMHTGRQAVQSNRKLLTTLAWQIAEEPPEYALEGSIFVTGAAVQWLRDGLGLIASADETEALARSVDSTDDVYFVPALTGLGAPYWDPHARGAIVGLTRGTTRAQLVRATLESIAYSTRDVLDAMSADAGTPLRELRADGGASANGFLMQFQADILGVPVLVPQNPETTALGAAFLAGLATGVWKSREEIATTWQPARRYTPREINRDALYARWQKAVERARDWAE